MAKSKDRDLVKTAVVSPTWKEVAEVVVTGVEDSRSHGFSSEAVARETKSAAEALIERDVADR